MLFFAALGLASISYIIEKRSVLAVAALAIGFVSWILYGLDIYGAGIAVPEAVSAMATSSWVVLAALRSYFTKSTRVKKGGPEKKRIKKENTPASGKVKTRNPKKR